AEPAPTAALPNAGFEEALASPAGRVEGPAVLHHVPLARAPPVVVVCPAALSAHARPPRILPKSSTKLSHPRRARTAQTIAPCKDTSIVKAAQARRGQRPKVARAAV